MNNNDRESESQTSQQELNTAPVPVPQRLDPIARLPLEISSQIFVHCLPLRPTPGAQHVPMLFLQMCRAWTLIAVSTPQLWSSVHAVFPRPKGFAHLLEAWLDRARYLPLSVSIHGALTDEIGTIFSRYREQLETLEIYLRSTVEKDVDILKSTDTPRLTPRGNFLLVQF